MRRKNVYPSLIIFSGDLVRDPDEGGVFDRVFDSFVDPLLKVTNLSPDRLFFVPGNHEVHRTSVRSCWSQQVGLENTLLSREDINNWYLSGRDRSFVHEKIAYYYEFSSLFGTGYQTHETDFFKTAYIRELDIAIALINTTWLSTAGLSDTSDRERLIFPEAALREAANSLPDAATNILVGHHPISWLAESVQSDFYRILSQNFHIYLHGHLHGPDPQQVSTLHGSTILNQIGSLYTGRNTHNSYSLINISTEQNISAIYIRTYFDQREEFAEGVNVIDGGTYYPPQNSPTEPVGAEHGGSAHQVKQWIEEIAKPTLEPTLNQGISDRPLCEVFVEPPIKSAELEELHGETEQKEQKSTVQFVELYQSNSNFIIYGPPEFGKTTLIKQVGYHVLCNQSQSDFVVPVLLDFNDIKPGRRGVQRLIRAELPDNLPGDFNVRDLLADGKILVLIDDVNFKDETRVGVLKDFLSQYPRARYIFTSEQRFMENLGAVADFDSTVPFKYVKIEPMGRRGLRDLVEKWDTNGGVNHEDILDRLINDFVHINLPFTAVNGTIMLTIFENRTDFTPINRAVLIERFVETLLEKNSLEEAKRSNFDFKNKTHLLSYIAKRMVEEDIYEMSKVYMYQVGQEYFKHTGLRDQTQTQIDNFIASKIFVEKGGFIRFRYRAFLEYFVALAMFQNKEFRGMVLSDEHYLSFPNEIEYYAAIARDDVELLDLIGERFAKLTDRVKTVTQWQANLNDLDNLVPPHKGEREYEFKALEEQLKAPPLTKNERDELLEAELPKDVGGRQDVFRPFFEEDGSRWNVCLFLYSGVIRNSELVSDEKTREHLRAVLFGWGMFTFHSLLLVPNLARHREMVVNGVAYRVVVPGGMDEAEVARILFLSMPRSVSDLVKRSLATEKLEKQLKSDTITGEQEPKIVQFYKDVLFAELRLPGYLTKLDHLREILRGSEYLLEAYVWKLRYLLPRLQLSQDEDTKLRKIIASAKGSLSGVSAGKRRKVVSETYQRLEREKLVERLRMKARDEGRH